MTLIPSKILEEIDEALWYAVDKHPKWPKDPLRQAVVVAEEANEALKEQLTLIELVEQGHTAKTLTDKQKHIRMEMIQTAAMAIRWLENNP